MRVRRRERETERKRDREKERSFPKTFLPFVNMCMCLDGVVPEIGAAEDATTARNIATRAEAGQGAQAADNGTVSFAIETIPARFIDAITDEIMRVPMILPSGNIVDLSTLKRLVDTSYATAGATDPYTGALPCICAHASTCARQPVPSTAPFSPACHTLTYE